MDLILSQIKRNDPCYQFSEEYATSHINEVFFEIIDKDKPLFLLPSLFYLFLGKYVRLEFSGIPLMENEDLLKTSKPENFIVNGNVTIIDPVITGNPLDNLFKQEIPRSKDLLNSKSFSMESPFFNGSSCTSVFPIFQVTDTDLNNFRQSTKNIRKYERFFYALYLSVSHEDTEDTSVFFYLSAPVVPEKVVLTHKSKTFVLSKSNKFLDLEGEYSNCLLYTSPSPRDLSTSRMPSSA